LKKTKRISSCLSLTAAALLVLIAGGPTHAKTTAEKVKKETIEAVDAAGTYAGEKKEEFSARMKNNIDQLDREIESLKSESATKSMEVREATKRKIVELQVKRDELSRKYDALEKSTGKAWTTLKTGVERAWGDVRNAYSDAKNELTSKK
jgi:predicted secreted Zn-dependent protease